MTKNEKVAYLKENYAADELLDAFIEHEVPFRLQQIHGQNKEQIMDIKDEIICELQNNTDVLFDYDRIDAIIKAHL